MTVEYIIALSPDSCNVKTYYQLGHVGLWVSEVYFLNFNSSANNHEASITKQKAIIGQCFR